MNQSKLVAISCNLLKVWEKSCVQGAIGIGFPSHRSINWRKIFKPITKRGNCNWVIAFKSHLKTALLIVTYRVFHGQLMVIINMYGLLTKHEVKMAGYWPSSFFCVFMDQD